MKDGLAGYPTGVVLVAATHAGKAVGMLANSFTSVSLDPPLVSLAFARTSTTWRLLQHAASRTDPYLLFRQGPP